MILDPAICDRARLARDPRFDGLFFIGVLSTGIFCRPVCPARSPKRSNIVYFPTAAAAAQAGLRPCLRCRPEASPGSPAWNGTSATVSRALMLIRQGALNESGMEDLAGKLGVGSRHLRRLFKIHIGASPLSIAMTQRVLFAKKLLNETQMPVTQVAYASGFGSIRRFNAAFAKYYGRSPASLRRQGRAETPSHFDGLFPCRLTLPYRPPYDWHRMLAFFRSRAIAGVESIADGRYHRTIRLNDTTGTISVGPAASGNALVLDALLTDNSDLMLLVERVRRMFDLDANMAAIHEVLTRDSALAPLIKEKPGLRLPGAWDPFETAARAVVGQQISVKGARTVIGRIARRAGKPVANSSHPELTHFFPTAHDLRQADLERIGLPARRVETLKLLAQAVMNNRIIFAGGPCLEEVVSRLTRIPGIGDWTARYIAMRALGEPDAFPAADLGILSALQSGGRRASVRQVRQHAENWRPWRAYAAVHLWHQ